MKLMTPYHLFLEINRILLCNVPAGSTMEFTIRLYKILSEIANAALKFRAIILELYVIHDRVTYSN